MADSTASGIDSLSAQENSTIRLEIARVTLRVSAYVTAVPSRLYGTSLSARAAARVSLADFSFSEFSIILTIWS